MKAIRAIIHLIFVPCLTGKKSVEIFDEAVMTFLPFGKQQQVDLHVKLAFFGEVHWEQISFFKSKHVDGNLVLLLKLWDPADIYRILNTIQVDFIHIGSVMMNSLWVSFEWDRM